MTSYTRLVLTGRALVAVGAVTELARALAPAVMVLEDVNLVAEERGMGARSNPVLFDLLDAMDGAAAPAAVGSVDAALAYALRILNRHPEAALQQALEILKVVPDHPIGALLVGSARRLLGDTAAALAILEALACSQPRAAAVHYELGLALAAAGRGDDAIASLRRAAQLNQTLPGVWRALADHLSVIGDTQGAQAAYARHIKAGTGDPRLLTPAAALVQNDIPRAEMLLRAHLREYPNDVAALRMLAEVAARLGRYRDAEALLARCLELAPSFAEARAQYASVLNWLNCPMEAGGQIDRLLSNDRSNPHYRSLKAAILVAIGEYQQACDLYASLLAEYPQQSKIWLSHGNVLKTLGRSEEAISAYRRALELAPGLSDAWWSLANLKTFHFTPGDVAAMQSQLARTDCTDDDRRYLHFALGKVFEDAEQYEQSFQHYDRANSLQRALIGYRAEDTSSLVERSRSVYTREFLRERSGAGCLAPDPIFIVGLPRAGSTLVDQILSCHPLVEGTMELNDITSLARELGAAVPDGQSGRYPEAIAALDPGRLRALGEAYLARTRVQRKTDAPFFIDKMPNNFLHLGLIVLTLPNAKIIDVRRHPLGCCFSAFKQYFARGQYFSYSLKDIGHYYCNYVGLMDHFDRMLPGRVHRVFYEAMVEDTEAEVRALLAYCGLAFEEKCLRFYESRRAVRTASSEQVRQPIFREGLDQWRHYEPWLDPLKLALGPVLQAYPAVPPPHELYQQYRA